MPKYPNTADNSCDRRVYMIDRNVILMKLEEYFKIAENNTRFVTIREKVEEYSKELHTDILDIKENIDITAELPEQCGVYIITTASGKYIGSTVNVKQRIRIHKLRQHIKTLDVYITKELDYAMILEDLLIDCIKPELNLYIPNIDEINMEKLMEDRKRREKMNANSRKYRKKRKDEEKKKVKYPTLSEYLHGKRDKN
jgi:predicted GIY-YIG superfamily endonuclease